MSMSLLKKTWEMEKGEKKKRGFFQLGEMEARSRKEEFIEVLEGSWLKFSCSPLNTKPVLSSSTLTSSKEGLWPP